MRTTVPAGLATALVAWLGVVVACGEDRTPLGSAPNDAAATPDASPSTLAFDAAPATDATALPPADAGPRCDPTKPFGVPTPLTSVNTADEEHDVHLSADELRIYVTVRESVDGGQYDIFTATRTSETGSFGNLERVSGLNGAGLDQSPSVADNGLWVVFASGRDGGPGGIDLYRATRANPNIAFDEILPLPNANSDAGETDPWTLPNALYWASNRGGAGPSVAPSAIFRATFSQSQNGVTVGAPDRVLGLGDGGPAGDFAPVVSADERTIFFGSSRSGASNQVDIYTATRASNAAAFDDPSKIDVLSSTANEFPTWISPDGCRIYFVSDRPFGGGGGMDAWFATRGK